MQIDELIDKAEKLRSERISATTPGYSPSKILQMLPIQKCRDEIDCYKKLYKFGKEKKCDPGDLFLLVQHGFGAAIAHVGLFMTNQELFEEFKNHAVVFAKAAEGFSKILGKETVQPEEWRKRHQNFRNWLMLMLTQVQLLNYGNLK